jgi:hypothetical protein
MAASEFQCTPGNIGFIMTKTFCDGFPAFPTVAWFFVIAFLFMATHNLPHE